MRVSIASPRIRSLCSDGARSPRFAVLICVLLGRKLFRSVLASQHMHHASAHKKEVVRMTFLFGHRYIHVGRACLGRALMVVSIFFGAGQAIVMVAVEACTNDW